MADRPIPGRPPRDRGQTSTFQKGDEPWEQPRRVGQIVPQRAAQPQIVIQMLFERGHRVVPGQGCATDRSDSRSTLAYSAVVARS